MAENDHATQNQFYIILSLQQRHAHEHEMNKIKSYRIQKSVLFEKESARAKWGLPGAGKMLTRALPNQRAPYCTIRIRTPPPNAR
jgi:hypothetical protein